MLIQMHWLHHYNFKKIQEQYSVLERCTLHTCAQEIHKHSAPPFLPCLAPSVSRPAAPQFALGNSAVAENHAADAAAVVAAAAAVDAAVQPASTAVGCLMKCSVCAAALTSLWEDTVSAGLQQQRS